MKLFINLFRDGGVLLEDQAAGDQSIELNLDEQTANTLRHLLALESFCVSAAAGQLFWLGVQHAHQQSRRPVTAG